VNLRNRGRVRGTYRLRFRTSNGFPAGIRHSFRLRRCPIRRTFRSLDRFRRGTCVSRIFGVGLRGCPRARRSPTRRRGRRRHRFDCLFDGQQSSLHVHALALADEDLITFGIGRAFGCRPGISLFVSPRSSTTWIAIAVPTRHASLETHRERVLQCPALQQEERKRRGARFEIAPGAVILL